MRHRSPKTENYCSSNFLKSQKKRQFNIIPLDNKNNNDSFFNKKNYNNNNNNNHLIFNYNKNNYNYYDEITKAFNFITFVLKQKDLQIQELKIKIKDLEKQLNDINETNIMTFNNQEIINSSSKEYDLQILNNNSKINCFQNNNNLKSPDSSQSKIKLMMNKYASEAIENKINNNSSNIINVYKNNENNKSLVCKNMNIIHKIKNSTNINKINNYRNKTDLDKNKFNSNIMNNIPKTPINLNTNEHSSEKKNINKIRKESYHSQNNFSIRNKMGNKKEIKITEPNNFKTENDNMAETDKEKGQAFDGSIRFGSKCNSTNISDDGNMMTSKNEVKNYLKEVKKILEPEKFKIFINQIKALTKSSNSEQKNLIILKIKSILGDKNLINKFDSIMKITKN